MNHGIPENVPARCDSIYMQRIIVSRQFRKRDLILRRKFSRVQVYPPRVSITRVELMVRTRDTPVTDGYFVRIRRRPG